MHDQKKTSVYLLKEADEDHNFQTCLGKRRRSRFFVKNHGSSTFMQKSGYVINGTALWLTVVLIMNYVSLLGSRFKPGFGSSCVLEFKKCIDLHEFGPCAASLYNCGDVGSIDYRVFRMPKVVQEVSVRPTLAEHFSANDNQANRNMCIFNAKNDEKLCRVLCKTDSFDVQMENECREICAIASDLSAFDDCPFEKNCPSGCPCPKYDCKKNFYPAETTMILTTAKRIEIPQNYIVDLTQAEVIRHLMIMSFNENNICMRDEI